MRRIFLITGILLLASPAFAQDTSWTQAMEAWVDGVYYPNFFLGGNYITKVSLADIDADGDLDMFYGGGDSGSLTYFENTGTAQAPQFKLALEEFPGLRRAGRETGIVDADFADLDGDGDLDAAFASDIDIGGALCWNDGTSEMPAFSFRYPVGPREGQGNPTLVDIDADGDYDWLSGAGYRYFQLYFTENIGSDTLPSFIIRTRNYQNLDFGVPFNFDMGDLDGDGDYDLLVCGFPGPVAYYRNTGAPDSAFFSLASDNFLPERGTTDWLESPELADIDSDGDLDLFLSGAFAHLYYFENTGDREAPVFEERYDTSFFYVFPGTGNGILGNAADIDGDGDDDLAPGPHLLLNQSAGGRIAFERVDRALPFNLGSFCDTDSDGDFDYVCPGWEGVVKRFENTGGPSWPSWGPVGDLFAPESRLGFVWSVTTGDLDGDGDQDLLAAHTGADLMSRYTNEGTPQSPSFVYAGRFTLPSFDFEGSFELLLGDIDDDADLDLLVGEGGAAETRHARLFFYRNTGTPQAPVFVFVTHDFQAVVSAHRNSGVAPCLADIDRDGDKDLVVTSNSLGLQAFLNPLYEVSINAEETRPVAIDISLSAYPNPFNSSTMISVSGVIAAEIGIYDITGRMLDILQTKNGRAVWGAAGLSSGVYFARVMGERGTATLRLVVVR